MTVNKYYCEVSVPAEKVVCKNKVSEHFLPRKIDPCLGLEFRSRLGLVLGWGPPRRNIYPWLRLGVGSVLILGLGGNFARGQLS